MVIEHLRETFYLWLLQVYYGFVWGDQQTTLWIVCSSAFTWTLGIELRLQGLLNHLTAHARIILKEKGLNLACHPWLAVYIVSRPIVRQNMVVEGQGGNKAAYLMVTRKQKKEGKVPFHRYTSNNPLLPTRTPPINEVPIIET